jgi:hypothetical protein
MEPKSRPRSQWPTASPLERGYGREHRAERKRWKVKVEAGGVLCARCHGHIEPGSEWDLDHDDHDRSVYLGASHRSCNRAANRLSITGTGRLPSPGPAPARPVSRSVPLRAASVIGGARHTREAYEAAKWFSPEGQIVSRNWLGTEVDGDDWRRTHAWGA